MDKQPELVGGGLAAGRAIRGELQLVRLDQVFRLAAGAVDLLVQPPRRALEVGDDEPAVAALIRGLDPGDDLPLGMPALGGVAERAVAADLAARVLVRVTAVSSARCRTLPSST